MSIFDKPTYEVLEQEVIGLRKEVLKLRQSKESGKVNENLFQKLFESTQDAILHLDPELGNINCNEAALKLFAIPSKDILPNLSPDKLSPVKQPSGSLSSDLVERKIADAMENRNCQFEWMLQDLNNREFLATVLVTKIELDGRTILQGIIRENSDHKLAKEALRKSYTQLQAIYNTLPVIIWSLDENGIVTLSEGKELASLGLKPGQIVGMSGFEFYKDNQLIIEQMEKGLRGEFCEYESNILGNIYHNVLTPFFDENDTVLGLNGLAINVTEKRKVEEELRDLCNYLSNIIDSMPSVLIGVNNQGAVTQWNKEAERLTGISPDAATGQPLEQVFPRLSKNMGQIQEAICKRQVKSSLRQARLEDNLTQYEDVIIFPLTTNGIEGAVVRVDDVTEHVHIQEMIIQSEKMLSVGGLAAGMAHEINNPLAGMLQTAAVLNDRLTNSQTPANLRSAEATGTTMETVSAFMELREVPRMLENIHESGRRVAAIVTNMLSFARKSDDFSSVHDPVDLLDQTIELTNADCDLKKEYDFRQIEIIRQYEDHLPLIPCETGKIQQVLLNIIRNGAEAMQQNTEKPRFIFRLVHEPDKEMVRFEIEDNGPGMNEKIRKRVFEPFYTTKPTGQGTGLGLSVSYFIIVENHGGEISVESDPEEGATFIINLPTTRSSE